MNPSEIIGCIWPVKSYSGSGRNGIESEGIQTHKCADCNYIKGGIQCQNWLRNLRADPLTREHYEDMMLHGFSHRPKPKDPPTIDLTAWGMEGPTDEDGGVRYGALVGSRGHTDEYAEQSEGALA